MKELSINRIPAALLLEVTEIATVYSARVAKSKDLITLTATSGATKNMTKAEFAAKKFCSINGKEIRLLTMKSGIDYMVYHIVNSNSFAIKVPRGNKSIIHLANGTDLTAGKALVIPMQKVVKNDDGTYDLSAGHVMSEAIFRKTCILRAVSNELLAQIQNKPVEEVAQATTPIAAQPTTTTQPVTPPAQKVTPPTQQPTPVAEQPTATTQPKPAHKVNKGQITYIIKDRRNNTLGYRVVTDKGAQYTLGESQVMNLCEQGAISNATVVHNNTTGKRYLRGVNCSLDDIPIITQDQ